MYVAVITVISPFSCLASGWALALVGTCSAVTWKVCQNWRWALTKSGWLQRAIQLVVSLLLTL